MFKQVIAVAAMASMMIAGQANAQAQAAKAGAKAAEEVGAAVKGGRSLRPGQAAGAKVNGSGVVSEKSSAAAGVTAKSTSDSAVAQTGVDSHLSCPVDSPVSKLATGDQAVLQEAVGMGVGGSACLNNFSSIGPVEAVIAGDREAIAVAKSLGVTDAAKTSKANVREIAKAWAKGVAKKLGVSAEEGRKKLSQLCANKCDTTSAALCAVAAM